MNDNPPGNGQWGKQERVEECPVRAPTNESHFSVLESPVFGHTEIAVIHGYYIANVVAAFKSVKYCSVFLWPENMSAGLQTICDFDAHVDLAALYKLPIDQLINKIKTYQTFS